MNLFYQPGITDGVLHLEEDESRHCVKVLRKSAGDIIRITDGKGSFYNATITKADPRSCQFTISDKEITPARPFRIHIAIAPTKNTDRIEWFVEKVVEFGIDEITLIDCDHSERSFIKSDRLKKIAISAMKQSLKSVLPFINNLTPFENFISKADTQQKFIAYVDAANPTQLLSAALKNKSVTVAIGPEGDFSNGEIALAQANGFTKVGLGPSRLRTETAGVAACHIVNLVNQ